MKEKVLCLNILAAKGVTKQLLRSEHIFLLLLDHLQNQALNIMQIKAKMSSFLTVLSCQHCSLLLSAWQMMK